MIELHDTADRPERVFLIGVQDTEMTPAETESLLVELSGLSETLGLEEAGRVTVKVRERHAAFLFGSGKVEELIAQAKAVNADTIVFDLPLSPTQQRNWEAESGLTVYDRHEMILRIFGARAKTREAVLQVELARLKYALPRLAHSYEDLSRQRGGRYGTKGSGEQKIELDRREIKFRITQIKDELEIIVKERENRRKKRDRVAVPQAAIVGYTNSGKSSLLNALTNASVVAEDKLFATLDPTTRRIEYKGGRPLLLTDTVGFVRNLPHGLVDAFKSTLEEAARSDLLVHVLDASDPDVKVQYALTRQVLSELGAEGIDTIMVLNKIDLVSDVSLLDSLEAEFPGAMRVSALKGAGVDALSETVCERLVSRDSRTSYAVPESRYDLVALAYREGTVYSESYEDGNIILDAALPDHVAPKFAEWEA